MSLLSYKKKRTKTITTCVITKLPMHHRCRVHMPVTGSVTQALTITVFVISCKTITTRVITKVPRHQRCRVHMPVTGSVTQTLLSNVFVIPLKDEPKTITTRVITNVPRHQRYRVHMPVTGNAIQALTSYVIVKNTPVTAKTKRTSDQERWHCPAPHEKASPASCIIPQAALKELNLHMQAAPHNAAPRAESLCSLLMTRFVTTARPETLSCRQWGRESGTAVCESCEGTRTSKTCEQRQRRGGRLAWARPLRRSRVPGHNAPKDTTSPQRRWMQSQRQHAITCPPASTELCPAGESAPGSQ
jgi:hypothetical protein